jgi:uncharacterized protein (DUF2236 family)
MGETNYVFAYHQGVEPVFPDPDEIPALVVKPGSVVWRYSGDARLIATGAFAILLQVGHPTVGAGVSEHSRFKTDPWGRLLRTLDYSYAMTYGGPTLAAQTGRRIRQMHKRIEGVRPDGERYHALEPEVFAWVHATLAHSVVRGHELLGRPMSSEQIEEFYVDWRRAGRLIGIRERDLPSSWADFSHYFEWMVEDQLERTPAVDEVLESLASPTKPPLDFLPTAVWRAARLPAMHQTNLITAGLLPPQLRERFGIRWTLAREGELRVLAAASRAATPLLPQTLRNVGPSYLRWRHKAITGDATAPSGLTIAA